MSDTFNLTRLAEQLEDNAVGPADVTVDGNRVVQHSLKDQIEVYRFAASVNASSKNHRGMRFTKIVPPANE